MNFLYFFIILFHYFDILSGTIRKHFSNTLDVVSNVLSVNVYRKLSIKVPWVFVNQVDRVQKTLQYLECHGMHQDV